MQGNHEGVLCADVSGSYSSQDSIDELLAATNPAEEPLPEASLQEVSTSVLASTSVESGDSWSEDAEPSESTTGDTSHHSPDLLEKPLRTQLQRSEEVRLNQRPERLKRKFKRVSQALSTA